MKSSMQSFPMSSVTPVRFQDSQLNMSALEKIWKSLCGIKIYLIICKFGIWSHIWLVLDTKTIPWINRMISVISKWWVDRTLWNWGRIKSERNTPGETDGRMYPEVPQAKSFLECRGEMSDIDPGPRVCGGPLSWTATEMSLKISASSSDPSSLRRPPPCSCLLHFPQEIITPIVNLLRQSPLSPELHLTPIRSASRLLATSSLNSFLFSLNFYRVGCEGQLGLTSLHS